MVSAVDEDKIDSQKFYSCVLLNCISVSWVWFIGKSLNFFVSKVRVIKIKFSKTWPSKMWCQNLVCGFPHIGKGFKNMHKLAAAAYFRIIPVPTGTSRGPYLIFKIIWLHFRDLKFKKNTLLHWSNYILYFLVVKEDPFCYMKRINL